MDTNSIRGDAEIQNFLQTKLNGGGIAEAVADEVLQDEDLDMKEWFDGLAQNGCVSGWVNRLIYYTDTHAFFDEHYNEIEELREYWEEQIGQPLQIDGDLKNCLAWFAFEVVAQQIMQEAGWD